MTHRLPDEVEAVRRKLGLCGIDLLFVPNLGARTSNSSE